MLSINTRCECLVGGSLCVVVVAQLSCKQEICGSIPCGGSVFLTRYFGPVCWFCVGSELGKEFLRTGGDVVLSINTRCECLAGGSLCGVVVAHLSCKQEDCNSRHS